MERISNLQNNNESFLEEVKKKIKFAQENAVSLELLKKRPFPEDDMELINKATIHNGTLFEFGSTLELLGFSKEIVEDVLAHENAHGNKTTIVQADHQGYKIIVGKQGNTYGYLPSIEMSIPEEWNFESKKDALIQILKAPLEYGNKLSADDIAILKNLE